MANLSHSDQMRIITDLEIEMMADMYNRMSNTCQKKCIPPRYKEADLSKGESVCLDRCIAKYLDIHDRIGKKITAASLPEQEKAKNLTLDQKKIS